MKKPAKRPAAGKPSRFLQSYRSVVVHVTPLLRIQISAAGCVDVGVKDSSTGIRHITSISLADAANLAEFIRSYCANPENA
ncbi:hypothetical protein OH491_17540 [Termitidicoccus mucosus]|uniref:hypothetical protein n=1 Tax=Termitidicoccus mucosus TaxID=1184151 RepID=UPI0011AB5778